MYDYYLGGKDNFAADREAADTMIAAMPWIPAAARANREFLGRAVAIAAEAGVRQFIDIGSGLPTQENTHQVAHKIDPGIRVAYVDNDPGAITHARELLQEGDPDTVRAMDGELTETFAVTHLLSDFIDFGQPVAVMLVAVMHFIPGPQCYHVVADYIGRMAPGSYLILSHSTADMLTAGQARVIHEQYGGSNAPIHLRTRKEVARLFHGTGLLEPGVGDVADWRADDHVPQTTMVWGGVGRKAAA
jgi:hypothetical protein